MQLSDDSCCSFDKHRFAVVVCPEDGSRVLTLYLTSNEWEVMNIKDFLTKLTKAKMYGIDHIHIEGEESHHHFRFLVQVLPELKLISPVRLTVDGCRFLLVEKLKGMVDGFCVDIRLPLQPSYTQADKMFCRGTLGEYRNPTQYREMIRKVVNAVDDMPLTLFRIRNIGLIGEEGKASILKFLDNVKSPVILGA